MQTWAFHIDDDGCRDAGRGGFVRARSVDAALDLLHRDRTTLVELVPTFEWPGLPQQVVFWSVKRH